MLRFVMSPGTQAVAKTTDGPDEVPPELPPDPADMDFNRIALDLASERIERIFDCLFGHRRVRPPKQYLEHSPLPCCDLHRDSVQPREACLRLEFDRPQPNCRD